jgi:ribonuclease D
MSDRLEAPTKAEIARLEPFLGLPLERIFVPQTKAQIITATTELARSRFVGFDTESKPTFKIGEMSDGPHVVQLATLDKAYIFQLHRIDCYEFLVPLLEATNLVKVGFGLKSDRVQLHRKLGIEPRAILDLNILFRNEGYRRELGVRAAVAIMFNKRLQKSKSVSTSNWALPLLKQNQQLYAANDAYAALKILQALEKPEAELPISGRTLPSSRSTIAIPLR